MGSKLALIKLGGSVVTHKDRPLQANHDAIDNIAKTLAGIDIPIVAVHGGGSFGHHWSVKYGMHTKPDRYDLHGISVVHESMIALNQIIVNSMLKCGLNPYGILPSAFMNGFKPIPVKIKELQTIANQKIIPVTFGDVIHVKDFNYSILSGDAIMTVLAAILKPSIVIFATNVDGIYKSLETRELVKEIVVSDLKGKKVSFSQTGVSDVTGGMKRKVTEAFKIASFGIDVLMVNGLVPERIKSVVQGDHVMGTLIKSARRKKN